MSSREQLVNLVANSGPAPDGVDQITYIIASTPAGPLSHAARAAVPSYEQLVHDKQQGGGLAEYMHDNPTPEIALGTDIMLKQQELSRPSRRLATIACAVALFAGGGALTNKSFSELDKGMPKQARTSTAHRLEADAVAGTIFGAGGALIASFTALGFAGRLARRPAQKIVREAAKSSTK